MRSIAVHTGEVERIVARQAFSLMTFSDTTVVFEFAAPCIEGVDVLVPVEVKPIFEHQ